MKYNNLVSIIICCYNSEKRLPRVLQAIAAQKGCVDENWEVIVVNNNSTDNTYTLATEILSSVLFAGKNCKVVDEPNPGLSAAREKGFKESRFDYVIFCDDDNLMEENFIANALQLIQDLPEVDIFGAWCKGEFEIQPPKWSVEMLSALAVGRPAATSGIMDHPVNGACMVVKKSSYLKLKSNSFQFLLTDRKGDMLTSGGDTELCYAIFLNGGKIYFSENLFFLHMIPAARLQKKYFKKLYNVPAKQDYAGMIYQWVIKYKETRFNKLYFFILFTYCKTLLYAIKKMITTGNFFYYNLLFKQRLSFLVYCLFHPKVVKTEFSTVMDLYKALKK